MKNYVVGLYNKLSAWLDTFDDKEWWKKLILIVCAMIITFGITFGICWLLRKLIWVVAAIAAIAVGIFIYCRIKKEQTNG